MCVFLFYRICWLHKEKRTEQKLEVDGVKEYLEAGFPADCVLLCSGVSHSGGISQEGKGSQCLIGRNHFGFGGRR